MDGKGIIVQKDRFIFAIIIYGLVLLTAAGVCSVMLPGEISAVANNGEEAGDDVTPTPDMPEPSQAVVPTSGPEQGSDDDYGNGNGPEHQNPSEQGKAENEMPDEAATGAWALLSVETTAAWREIIGERCIVLQKPQMASGGQGLSFSLTEMPVERSIVLRVQGCEYVEYGYEAVERIAGEQYFAAEPGMSVNGQQEEATAKDPLDKMTASCTQQEDGSYELHIELLLDKTYVYDIYETKTHYVIALKEAKEVYDIVVVLDAGHGGEDTGTLSKDGMVPEKDINLQVMLYLEKLLNAKNIKVYATRATDWYVEPAERIALANDLEADMFISIHCSNVYQDVEANGTEVLYAEQELTGSTKLKAKALARICAEKLTETMPSENGAVWVPDEEVTVLQEAEVPAVQVELDMELLQTEEGQKAAAQALCDAVLDAYHSTLPE